VIWLLLQLFMLHLYMSYVSKKTKDMLRQAQQERRKTEVRRHRRQKAKGKSQKLEENTVGQHLEVCDFNLGIPTSDF